ncbi:hypothetical protein B0H16DRAFT_1457541 [Mycena metata]|uniref:Uncharacterized protein n=1 Tax=Mycena metata TaxID=1033252 RepID=A0AAD7J6R6_9AGAR|nr:hypothetical protein B0H16DRAFT_1457541 [Mycena metata]
MQGGRVWAAATSVSHHVLARVGLATFPSIQIPHKGEKAAGGCAHTCRVRGDKGKLAIGAPRNPQIPNATKWAVPQRAHWHPPRVQEQRPPRPKLMAGNELPNGWTPQARLQVGEQKTALARNSTPALHVGNAGGARSNVDQERIKRVTSDRDRPTLHFMLPVWRGGRIAALVMVTDSVASGTPRSI